MTLDNFLAILRDKASPEVKTALVNILADVIASEDGGTMGCFPDLTKKFLADVEYSIDVINGQTTDEEHD